MTMEIKLSQIESQEKFATSVRAYALEVRNWIRQEENVKRTKDAIDDKERYASYPHPTASPLIVSAVNDTGYLDYAIVDDTTEQNEIKLRSKKSALFDRVNAIVGQENEKIVPTGKQLLIDLKMDALNTKMATIEFISGNDYLTPEEEIFVDDVKEQKRKRAALQWWTALMYDQIADLTIENVDQWEPSPFTY